MRILEFDSRNGNGARKPKSPGTHRGPARQTLVELLGLGVAAFEIPAAARDFAGTGLTAIHHGPDGAAGTHSAVEVLRGSPALADAPPPPRHMKFAHHAEEDGGEQKSEDHMHALTLSAGFPNR